MHTMAEDRRHTDVSLLDEVRLLTLEKSHLLELVKEYLSCLVQAEGKLADFRILLDIKEAEIGLLRAASKGLGDRELRNEAKECRVEVGELRRENGYMRALLQAEIRPEEPGKGLESALTELKEVTQERNTLKYDVVPKLQQALHLFHLEKTELEQKLGLSKKAVSDVRAEPSVPMHNTAPCLLSKQNRGGFQPLYMRKRAAKPAVHRGVVCTSQRRK